MIYQKLWKHKSILHIIQTLYGGQKCWNIISSISSIFWYENECPTTSPYAKFHTFRGAPRNTSVRKLPLTPNSPDVWKISPGWSAVDGSQKKTLCKCVSDKNNCKNMLVGSHLSALSECHQFTGCTMERYIPVFRYCSDTNFQIKFNITRHLNRVSVICWQWLRYMSQLAITEKIV